MRGGAHDCGRAWGYAAMLGSTPMQTIHLFAPFAAITIYGALITLVLL